MRTDLLLDAFGEIKSRYILEAAPGRVRPRPGAVLAAAAALFAVVIGAIAIPRLTRSPEPAPPVPVLAEGEMPAGPAEYDSVLWVHSLTLSGEAAAYEPPETVELGIFRDAVFTEEEINAAVQNLLDAGWEDMTCTNYEGKAVFFSQPDRDPMSLDEILAEKESGVIPSVTEQDLERARQFIEDSGLDELLLEKTGTELRPDTDSQSVILFRGWHHGLETGTYLRLSFYPNGDLAEAKLYAVIPETETVPALPLSEAVKNAFCVILYGGGDDYEPHTAIAVQLETLDGLPYYVFTLDEMWGGQPRQVRALAVDFSLIEEDEDLYRQWERQLLL